MNSFVRSSRDKKKAKKVNDPRLKTTVLNAANIFSVHAFMEFVNKATGLML